MKCPHCGKEFDAQAELFNSDNNIIELEDVFALMEEERKKAKPMDKVTKCYDCYYANADPIISEKGAGIAGDWYCLEDRVLDKDGRGKTFKDGDIIQEWCPYRKG